MLYISSVGRPGPITGRKIILVALLTCNGTFYRPLLHSGQTQHSFFIMDPADMLSITFIQNDAMDNFVNAYNRLALPEFGPFSILKNTHVVLKLWRTFGFKGRRNIWSNPTTFAFCLGYNSITFFQTWPTQCTVHVYFPWIFCQFAYGCANSFILILWVIGTDVTEKDTKIMVWYANKNLGCNNTFHF